MRSLLYIGGAVLAYIVLVSQVNMSVPVMVTPESVNDVYAITDPRTKAAYYGVLDGFPHTFEIKAEEPFTLSTQVLVPDIPSAKNLVSGIIIREVGFRGRVAEVSRMLARDASWESFYEPWGGDHYRRGTEFTKELEAGVYRIEVSTPDNNSPYTLIVGTEKGFSSFGYFKTIGGLGEVKAFFGKSQLRVVESPLVYVPLGVLIVGVFVYSRHRRRKNESV
jgi:hypothetical protein